LVGPSARYIDDGDYAGGFSEAQIEELLQFLETNHLGWSVQMAPAIIGNPDRPELGEELTNSFCRTDPEIAKAFARVTFKSDNRADLGNVSIPTLILQKKLANLSIVQSRTVNSSCWTPPVIAQTSALLAR
jgi:sigma-B regulation protein RsbQ